MQLPTLEQILELHNSSLKRFGGESGILHQVQLNDFVPLLQQAIYLGNKRIIEVAAWIIVRLTQNHYFVDGNKRVALGTMLNFLKSNKCVWKLPNRDFFYDLTMEIAMSQRSDILEFVEENLRKVIMC